MNFSQEPFTVESIRNYIAKELNGNNVPIRKTVERWLEESGQNGVERRIQEHISYWRNKKTQSTNTKVNQPSSTTVTPEPKHSIRKPLITEKHQGETLLEKLIGEQYNEPIEVLDYQTSEGQPNTIVGCFLELRRNWLFDFKVALEDLSIAYRPNALVRNSSETILLEVLPKFGEEEIYLMYKLTQIVKAVGGEVKILSEQEFPEDEETAFEEYGFYPICGYPIIVYRNQQLKVNACFYTFWDTKGKESLSEQLVVDEPQESVQVFSSPAQGFNHLVQRLSYYLEEQ